MSYFRICSMRSIQKTTFCGFIALLNKVLDFGGQLVNKFRFILLSSTGILFFGFVRWNIFYHTEIAVIY